MKNIKIIMNYITIEYGVSKSDFLKFSVVSGLFAELFLTVMSFSLMLEAMSLQENTQELGLA